MDQDKAIKLTLAAQIAGNVAKEYCKTIGDSDTIAEKVVDITKKIVDSLYDRI